MDPISIISIGTSLIKHVPDVIDWFKGDKSIDAAETLVGIAESITGEKSDKALQAIEQDPAIALKFKEAVMADKYKYDEMYLADRSNARSMNVASEKMGEFSSRTGDQIMIYNLPVIALLILIEGLVVVFLREEIELILLVSNVVGFVINSLLNERIQVTGYCFGSSMGSKMKDLRKKLG